MRMAAKHEEGLPLGPHLIGIDPRRMTWILLICLTSHSNTFRILTILAVAFAFRKIFRNRTARAGGATILE